MKLYEIFKSTYFEKDLRTAASKRFVKLTEKHQPETLFEKITNAGFFLLISRSFLQNTSKSSPLTVVQSDSIN